jgi:septal ring factor EnvC (AmiA/AmiB activator)
VNLISGFEAVRFASGKSPGNAQNALFPLAFQQIIVYFIILYKAQGCWDVAMSRNCSRRWAWLLSAIWLGIVGSGSDAFSAPGEAEQAAQQLDRLRREIQEFEKRLSETRHREQNLLGELEDYDREIVLRTELISRLEEEKKRAQQALQSAGRELDAVLERIGKTRTDSINTAKEKEALADLVKRRTIYAYKYLKRDIFKSLFTSRSVLQWFTRQEYLRRIAAADRSNLMRLDQKDQELAEISSELAQRRAQVDQRLQQYQKAAAYKEKLLQEESTEADILKKRRTEREALLKKVRQDKTALSQQLEEKKQAAQRIESLIRTLEKERESAPVVPPPAALIPEIPFQQLQGKLDWPTLGRVVAKFGLQKHEKLATVTENPGIDIEAQEGAPVTAVSAGTVTKITWLRGYGNTIIVDHRDGYYTVYAHLGQIQVKEGQTVRRGERIADVGQSGSISGPRLHFEIWAKREKQDPLLWLSSR